MRYTELYGDGDSKSFIVVENIYNGIKVVERMYRACAKESRNPFIKN